MGLQHILGWHDDGQDDIDQRGRSEGNCANCKKNPDQHRINIEVLSEAAADTHQHFVVVAACEPSGFGALILSERGDVVGHGGTFRSNWVIIQGRTF